VGHGLDAVARDFPVASTQTTFGAVDPVGAAPAVGVIVTGALKPFCGAMVKVTVSESLPVVPSVAGFASLATVVVPAVKPDTGGLVAVAVKVNEAVVV